MRQWTDEEWRAGGHYVVKFRNQAALAVAGWLPSDALRRPDLFGRAQREILTAKDEVIALMDRDTASSYNALMQMRIGVRDAAVEYLISAGDKMLKAIGQEMERLRRPAAPVDAVAREISLQRAEQRLGRMLDQGMDSLEIIRNADGAMLDAIEANPRVYTRKDFELDGLTEAVDLRRRELASPEELLRLDKIKALKGLRYNVETFTGLAQQEVLTNESWGVRDPAIWNMPEMAVLGR